MMSTNGLGPVRPPGFSPPSLAQNLSDAVKRSLEEFQRLLFSHHGGGGKRVAHHGGRGHHSMVTQAVGSAVGMLFAGAATAQQALSRLKEFLAGISKLIEKFMGKDDELIEAVMDEARRQMKDRDLKEDYLYDLILQLLGSQDTRRAGVLILCQVVIEAKLDNLQLIKRMTSVLMPVTLTYVDEQVRLRSLREGISEEDSTKLHEFLVMLKTKPSLPLNGIYPLKSMIHFVSL